ncbi:hypothetical protein GCM10009646_79360 [Streptomyces aureus]
MPAPRARRSLGALQLTDLWVDDRSEMHTLKQSEIGVGYPFGFQPLRGDEKCYGVSSTGRTRAPYEQRTGIIGRKGTSAINGVCHEASRDSRKSLESVCKSVWPRNALSSGIVRDERLDVADLLG